MPVVFVIGRIVFISYFVFAGLQRLMNVAGSAEYFSQKFAIPAALGALSAQAENIVGLSMPQLLALLSGAIELAAGLLIAFNVGTRVMAIILILIVGIGLYYSNDFWELTGGERGASLAQAMLQVSLIGGLIVFVALGGSRPGEPEPPSDV